MNADEREREREQLGCPYPGCSSPLNDPLSQTTHDCGRIFTRCACGVTATVYSQFCRSCCAKLRPQPGWSHVAGTPRRDRWDLSETSGFRSDFREIWRLKSSFFQQANPGTIPQLVCGGDLVFFHGENRQLEAYYLAVGNDGQARPAGSWHVEAQELRRAFTPIRLGFKMLYLDEPDRGVFVLKSINLLSLKHETRLKADCDIYDYIPPIIINESSTEPLAVWLTQTGPAYLGIRDAEMRRWSEPLDFSNAGRWRMPVFDGRHVVYISDRGKVLTITFLAASEVKIDYSTLPVRDYFQPIVWRRENRPDKSYILLPFRDADKSVGFMGGDLGRQPISDWLSKPLPANLQDRNDWPQVLTAGGIGSPLGILYFLPGALLFPNFHPITGELRLPEPLKVPNFFPLYQHWGACSGNHLITINCDGIILVLDLINRDQITSLNLSSFQIDPDHLLDGPVWNFGYLLLRNRERLLCLRCH